MPIQKFEIDETGGSGKSSPRRSGSGVSSNRSGSHHQDEPPPVNSNPSGDVNSGSRAGSKASSRVSSRPNSKAPSRQASSVHPSETGSHLSSVHPSINNGTKVKDAAHEHEDDGSVKKSGKNDDKPMVPRLWLWIAIVAGIVVTIVIALIVYYGSGCNGTSASNGALVAPTTKRPPPPPPQTTLSPTINPNLYYLPKNLVPSNYALNMQVWMPSPSLVAAKDQFKFTGQLTITFICVTPTNKIVMNWNTLQINASSLRLTQAKSKQPIPLQSNFRTDSTLQMVYFQLAGSGMLKANTTYQLSMNYQSVLNSNLAGLYKSSYMENGQTRWLAVTQFEPTDARLMLPCFDEPAFKATFSISMTAPPGYTALSNGIQVSNQTLPNGWMYTKFSTTPKMSSYLVAVALVDFVYKETRSKSGVRFRIWARRDLVDYVQYAADVGAQALDFYENRTGIKFPLPKQDMLACPDFDAGAMENWGLVTYRESYLVYQPGQNFLSSSKQGVTTTIVHELAHQWFGDLVTMSWWNDLFLNEAFATYWEYLCADQIPMVNGTMHMDHQFVPIDVDLSMGVDQILASRAITQQIAPTSASINNQFDTITYEGGGARLKMLRYTLTKSVFETGLHQYLTKYSYSNANHNQLWASLTAASTQLAGTKDWSGKPLNVTTMMNTWVEQMGFPVVNAVRSGNSVQLSQQRFLVQNSSVSQWAPSKYNYQWYIPIWYQTGTTPSALQWLIPNQPLTLTLPSSVNAQTPFLLNWQVRGYYRVNYDAKSWGLIKQTLIQSPNTFDVRNRAQIVDDLFNLAKGGQVTYTAALGILQYLKNEMSYSPWKSAGAQLSYFGTQLQTTLNYPVFRKYMQQLHLPVYKKVGWDDTKEPEENLPAHYVRQYAIKVMCEYELSADCKQKALGAFDNFKTYCSTSTTGAFHCDRTAGNLRATVYCIGVANGGPDDFNLLWKLYKIPFDSGQPSFGSGKFHRVRGIFHSIRSRCRGRLHQICIYCKQEQVSQERNNLMYGLSCTKDPWLLRVLLNEGLSAVNIRSQDARYTFAYIGRNPVGKEIVWNYVTSNWAQIRKKYATSFTFSISRVVTAATSHFNTQYQYNQVASFIKNNDLGVAVYSFQSALERIKNNMHWMSQYSTAVVQAMNVTMNTGH